MTNQGPKASPTKGLEIESLTFAKSLFTSDRVRYLPYKGKSVRSVPTPTDSDDSIFEAINQFKDNDADVGVDVGPSSQSLPKSMHVVLASLPSLIKTAESLVHALKDARDVLSAAAPARSDEDS